MEEKLQPSKIKIRPGAVLATGRPAQVATAKPDRWVFVVCHGVLIQVKAVGINPVDAMIRMGVFRELQLPFTVGFECAGTVAAVGSSCDSQFKVGDRVMACDHPLTPAGGSCAEFVTVAASNVFPLPTNYNFCQGASIPYAYLLAIRALIIRAKAKAGATILVHGASTAVGIAVCQTAAAWRMKVVGTAGTQEGTQLVMSNGATKAFTHNCRGYDKQLMEATSGKGFDVVLETRAHKNLAMDVELIGKNGSIVVMGTMGDASFNPRSMIAKECSIHGLMIKGGTDEEWKTMGEELKKGMQCGWVKPVQDTSFPFDKVVEAHKYQMEHKGGSKGKIILSLF